ncbi:contact-dependent growth inhibition system immunity protein [Acerihabitans sp. KWT182]|uniref:Contact-dependent growth inhibition system immunity protein n=1 Tax=Acerihabitans sp. KWT182 TaxID=3157919 RepID=A0AAU7QGD0_9GAMM
MASTRERLRISPSQHEKRDAWSGDGLTDADDPVLPADSSPAEIGAALRLAFSRCTG